MGAAQKCKMAIFALAESTTKFLCVNTVSNEVVRYLPYWPIYQKWTPLLRLQNADQYLPVAPQP